MFAKRIATGLTLLSAVVSCAHAQIYGPNLVSNGNFEAQAPILPGVTRILTAGSPGVGANTAFGGDRYGEVISSGGSFVNLLGAVELTPDLYRFQFAFAPSAPADRVDVIARVYVRVTINTLGSQITTFLPLTRLFTWSLRDQHQGYTVDNGNAWQFVIWELDWRHYAAVRLEYAGIQTLTPRNPTWRYNRGQFAPPEDGVLLDEVYFGTYNPVPEPSSLLALAVGGGGLLTRRWRRRLVDTKA